MEEKLIKHLHETKGKFLTFRQDEVRLSNGKTARRDLVLHPGAVAVVAVNAKREILLVKQYRYPVQEVLYEIPAGKLERGEEPLASARRELEEETGFVSNKWEKLSTFYSAPGFADETMHLFLAQELSKTEARPDPDEIIEYCSVSLDKAFEMLQSGEIRDAKTIVGILWVLRRLSR